MSTPVVELVRRAFARPIPEAVREGAQVIEKLDAGLTDNMRALRLVMTMSDQLLSRGMAASDVVFLAIGVASTYCSRRVHLDISHTIITVSQDRGIDREPLTLVKAVVPRGADYDTIRRIEQLALEIDRGRVPLDAAEARLDEIAHRRPLYPNWAVYAAAGGVSTGVVLLYSDHPVAWVLAFIMGVLVSMALYAMTRRGIPAFYTQAIAGFLIILIAVAASYLVSLGVIPFLEGVNPTFIVIGGIVMLVAGMMIVSAFQDALDEYYVTAAARLMKVLMMTGGIVLGVTVGLYIATRYGVELAATPDRLSLADINYRYVGAAVLAASFALGHYARLGGIISAGVVGFLSLYIVLVLGSIGIGQIAASGFAAACVGLAATLLFRLFKIPMIVTLSSGIIPLVPGLTLYSAFLYIAQADATADEGLSLLLRAVLIAFVVAAGVTFGNLLGRASRRRTLHYRNRLPQHRLARRKRA